MILKIFKNPLHQLAEYKFNDVIPLDISNIDLDMTAEGNLQEFSMIMHYHNWTNSNLASTGGLADGQGAEE